MRSPIRRAVALLALIGMLFLQLPMPVAMAMGEQASGMAAMDASPGAAPCTNCGDPAMPGGGQCFVACPAFLVPCGAVVARSFAHVAIAWPAAAPWHGITTQPDPFPPKLVVA